MVVDNCERYMVVEDFYKDPVTVREFALETEYFPKGVLSKNVAGIESKHSVYSAGVIDKLGDIVGSEITVDPDNHAFGRFRIMLEDDKRRTRVHTDNTDYTAVVYLSLDEHSTGGTYFYRHIPTGLETYPTSSQLQEMQMTKEQFDDDVVMKDTLDETKWEVVDFCEVKFNRCVILRGSRFFHGSNCFFGDRLRNGRITQNFFFNARNGGKDV